MLDAGGLVDNAMMALSSDEALAADAAAGFVDLAALITIVFPESPDVLFARKVPETLRAEVWAGFQQRVLGAWNAMLAKLKINSAWTWTEAPEYSIAFRNRSVPAGKPGLLGEALELEILLLNTMSLNLLERCLRSVLDSPHFQVAKDIKLELSYEKDGRVVVFSGSAASIPVRYWLTLDKMNEVLAFFSVPAVARNIADTCRGFNITCDQANEGAMPEKRRNVVGARSRSTGRRTCSTWCGITTFSPSTQRSRGRTGRSGGW